MCACTLAWASTQEGTVVPFHSPPSRQEPPGPREPASQCLAWHIPAPSHFIQCTLVGTCLLWCPFLPLSSTVPGLLCREQSEGSWEKLRHRAHPNPHPTGVANGFPINQGSQRGFSEVGRGYRATSSLPSLPGLVLSPFQPPHHPAGRRRVSQGGLPACLESSGHPLWAATRGRW